MAVTLGTANLGTATATTGQAATITTSAAITAGQLVVVATAGHAAATISSITGTFTGTWTIVNSSTTPNLGFAYCLNAPAAASGVTIIVNTSASGGFSCAASSFTGVATALDNSVSFKANASGTNTTNSITPTVAGDLVIASQALAATGLTFTYTNVSALNSATNGGATSTKAQVASAYVIQTSATAITATIAPSTSTANEMAIISFLAAAAPNAPTSFTASAASTTQVDTTWVAPTGQVITSYTVDRALDSGFTSSLTSFTGIAAGATSYSDTTAVASTTYWYRVKAINSLGTSANSGSATATTSAPTAPTGLTATAGTSTQASLAWTAGSGQTSYTLTRATDSGFTLNVGTVTGLTGTSYTDAAPFRSTWYYELAGVNGVGSSTQAIAAAPVTNTAGNTYLITGTIVNPVINGLQNHGMVQLSDGSLVFLLGDGSTTALTLYYTIDRITINTITSVTVKSSNARTASWYSGINLCVDASDNLYVITGDNTTAGIMGGQGFVKGTGYTWTAQTTLNGTTNIFGSGTSAASMTAALWCNTTGGTSSGGHILAIGMAGGTPTSFYATLDAGALLAGSGTLVINQGTNPTFLGTPTSSMSDGNLSIELSANGFGGTSGVSSCPTGATTLSIGSWAVSSAGALSTNSMISTTLTTATLTSSFCAKPVFISSNKWAILFPSATAGLFAIALYSSTTQLNAPVNSSSQTHMSSSNIVYTIFKDPSATKVWVITIESVNLRDVYTMSCDLSSGIVWGSQQLQDTMSAKVNGAYLRVITQPISSQYVDFQADGSNYYINDSLAGDYIQFILAASLQIVGMA